MRNNSLTILVLMLCLSSYGQTPFEKKTFVYKTVEKTPIRADLYRNTTSKEARPVIVWIHGGALISGSRLGLPDDQRNFYMDAGYNIVSIDYRLAPETKLPAILEDVKDAVTWVRKNGAILGIDPSRLYVAGHSAGGYLALTTGYILKDPPRGIVSFYGYGDIRADWYAKPDSFYLATRDHVTEQMATRLVADTVVTMSVSGDHRGDIYMYSRQNGKWPLLVGGKDPVKDEDWFYKYCPAKNVSAKYPPTILLHGDKDTDVPFQQSVEMDGLLTAKNVKHKFIPIINGEHGFDRANGGLTNPRIKEVFMEVVAFLATCR